MPWLPKALWKLAWPGSRSSTRRRSEILHELAWHVSFGRGFKNEARFLDETADQKLRIREAEAHAEKGFVDLSKDAAPRR